MIADFQNELFEQSDISTAILNLKGNFVKVNLAFCELLDISRENIEGGPFRKLSAINDSTGYISIISALLKGELKSSFFYHTFQKGDGSPIQTLIHIGVIKKDNQVMYFYLHAYDTAFFKSNDPGLVGKNHFPDSTSPDETDRFDTFINNKKEAFIEFNEHGCATKFNVAARNMFQLDERVLNHKICEKIIFPKKRSPLGASFSDIFMAHSERHSGFKKRFYGKGKDGNRFPIEITTNTYQVNNKNYYSISITNVSNRVENLKALIHRQLRLSEIIDSIPALVAHVDKNLNFTFINNMYEQYFSCKPESILNTSVFHFYDRKFFSPADFKIKKVYEKISYSFEKTIEINGENVVFNNTVIPAKKLQDGFYLLTNDITEFRNQQDVYRYDANHDLLTGLPNRRAVDDYLEHYRNPEFKIRHDDYGIGVLFFDLNGFKEINDSYGHDLGDKTLIKFSQIVKENIQHDDFFARLSGDEFLLIIERSKFNVLESEAELLVKKIHSNLASPVIIDDIEITIRTSIGVSLRKNNQNINIENLIIDADKRMYKNKRELKSNLLSR